MVMHAGHIGHLWDTANSHQNGFGGNFITIYLDAMRACHFGKAAY